jgi:hypothetical protein
LENRLTLACLPRRLPTASRPVLGEAGSSRSLEIARFTWHDGPGLTPQIIGPYGWHPKLRTARTTFSPRPLSSTGRRAVSVSATTSPTNSQTFVPWFDELRDLGMSEIEIACAFARIVRLAQEEWLGLVELIELPDGGAVVVELDPFADLLTLST